MSYDFGRGFGFMNRLNLSHFKNFLPPRLLSHLKKIRVAARIKLDTLR